MTMLENLARKRKKAIGKATAERRGPCSSHNNWTEVRDSLYMASIYRLTGVNFWQSAKHLSEKIEVDDRGVHETDGAPILLSRFPCHGAFIEIGAVKERILRAGVKRI